VCKWQTLEVKLNHRPCGSHWHKYRVQKRERSERGSHSLSLTGNNTPQSAGQGKVSLLFSPSGLEIESGWSNTIQWDLIMTRLHFQVLMI